MSKTVLISGGAVFIAHLVIDKIIRETDWKIVSMLTPILSNVVMPKFI
jgi:hypothetical protein